MQPYFGVHATGFYISDTPPTDDYIVSLGRIPLDWSEGRTEQLYVLVQSMLKHNIPESTILSICKFPDMPIEQLRLFLTPRPKDIP